MPDDNPLPQTAEPESKIQIRLARAVAVEAGAAEPPPEPPPPESSGAGGAPGDMDSEGGGRAAEGRATGGRAACEAEASEPAGLQDVYDVLVSVEDYLRRMKAALGKGALAQIEARLARMESDLVERLKTDKAKDAAFDKLYEEMRQYKENFLFRLQKPLFLDLILLSDHVAGAIERAADEAARETLGHVRDELLEILYRRDVEAMEFEAGARFDRQTMKAVQRAPAESEAEDGQTARLVRTGFQHDGQVLRPQEVVVKRWPAAGAKDEA